MENCNSCQMPTENRLKLGKNTGGVGVDATRYRGVIGSLWYPGELMYGHRLHGGNHKMVHGCSKGLALGYGEENCVLRPWSDGRQLQLQVWCSTPRPSLGVVKQRS